MGSLQLSLVSFSPKSHIPWSYIGIMSHNCSFVRVDEINNFNNAAGGNVKDTWVLGVQELYADDENFNACMIPFNGLRIDY